MQKSEQGGTLFHWGDKPNFKAFAAINLQKRSAVVYFTNSENGLSIANDVAEKTVGKLDAGLNYLFKTHGYERYDATHWKERHVAKKKRSHSRK